MAFYPDVDIQKAHQITSDYLINCCSSFGGDFNFNWVKQDVANIHMFRKALSIANKNLMCQFDEKLYHQVRGLTMGLDSSLKLANMYGCFFKDRTDVHLYPDIHFYKRYINDCLSLFYTVNKWSAKSFLKNLVIFNNCIIEQSASDSYITFLDITLFFDKNKLLQ